ncbi:MAG TPA: hypothetical protein VNT79_03730 [Phycisphaerae bacterium]|nr:hypothetical protein [Phycisphaerae bacterium]
MPQSPTRSRAKLLWRAVCLSLLLLHLPATLRVFALAFTDQPKWAALLLIGATNLFFLLEIAFGWTFSVLTDRRRVLAFLVIVAILHAGVLDNAPSDLALLIDANAWLVVAIGGAALVTRSLRRLPTLWHRWQLRFLSWPLRRQLALRHLAALNRAPCFARRFLKPSCPHRAPPF